MSPQAADVAVRVPFGALARDYAGRRAAIDAAVSRVLARGWFILGEEVAGFEEEFARWLGVEHVVACANGTEALALALAAAGARPTDEVIVPANTCGPTLAGVRLAGARPRLCDVDSETLTMDAAHADAAWSPAVRFVLPVHLYGGVADCEGLLALAASRGATLIEDCAQSHGASLGERLTGSFGAASAFSFYPTKNLGAYGDGGAVATGDAALAQRLRQLRQYGWSRRDFAQREGWNSRLDELQAAILRVKLTTVDAENARRRAIADRYDEAFAALPLRRLLARPGSRPARHLYPIRVERRDAFQAHLLAHGIETGVHYPVPLHLQPAWSFLGHRRGDFPVSEAACDSVVSLPLYPTLSEAQVDAVVGAVTRFYPSGSPAMSPSRQLISVIVPVYFNAESLPRLAQRLRAIGASADFDLEVVLVDDGSGDESWERIVQITGAWPAARGVRLTRNFGSQMAIAAGLREARGRGRRRPLGGPAGAPRAPARDGLGLAAGRDRRPRGPPQPARGVDDARGGRGVLPHPPAPGALEHAPERFRLLPDRPAGHRLSVGEP